MKKKCKKKKFQGTHDRFLRDHEFRVQMIEHNRDEEVCRRWDVLAEEDHTYHLSVKGYFYYKNKWWLHSNKSGSDTLPLRKTLSTLECLFTPRSWRRTIRAYLFLQAQTMAISTEFVFYMVELARFLVVFLTVRKSRKRQAKSWERTGRPVVNSTLAKTSEDGFQECNLFCYRQIVYS